MATTQVNGKHPEYKEKIARQPILKCEKRDFSQITRKHSSYL